MKNVFFALAFMLIGTFAFANTDVNSDIDLDKIESIINLDSVEISNDVIDAYSCSVIVNLYDGDGYAGSYDHGYQCGQNSNDFWNDFFYVLNNIFPGWTYICVNC